MKALIYCRVSSQKQVLEGDGLQSQEMRCVNYALGKGYVVEKIFRDPGISGGGDFINRPAMMAILAHMDAHPTEQFVVIFDDLKRFARDTEFHIKLRSALRARGATPECLNYNFDDSPEGRFTETIFAAQAQLEREQNKRQVIQKQKARLERGYWCFYHPPGFEYQKDQLHGKLLVPKEPQATILKEALESFAKGILFTQKDVREFLNARKLNDTLVSWEGVKRILTQPLYAGLIEYLPWEVARIKGRHKAIISEGTFDKIQARLNGTVKTIEREDEREEFSLRRFVVCEHCNVALTASWSTGRTQKYPYYRCKTSGCMGSIKKADLESDFTTLLGQTMPTEEILKLFETVFNEEAKERQSITETQVAEQEKLAIALEKEVEDITTLACNAKNETIREAYEKRLEKKQGELKSLHGNESNNRKGNVGTALEKGKEILKNPMQTWLNGNLKDKKMVQTLVFLASPHYSKKNKFGTAEYSVLYRVLTTSSSDKSYLVDQIRVNWNQIVAELEIFDQYLKSKAFNHTLDMVPTNSMNR